MKTALQQLIDKFEEEMSSGRNSKSENIAILWANLEAKKLLEIERQQIESAWANGWESFGQYASPSGYYESKFKQQ